MVAMAALQVFVVKMFFTGGRKGGFSDISAAFGPCANAYSDKVTSDGIQHVLSRWDYKAGSSNFFPSNDV